MADEADPRRAKVRIVGAEHGTDAQATAEERVLHASHKAAQARRDARDAQRSAAESLERSAQSQEQTAQAYEEAAKRTGRDDYVEHAARHRKYAHEDHVMAEELRRMAEAD